LAALHFSRKIENQLNYDVKLVGENVFAAGVNSQMLEATKNRLAQ
jgi:hypothetical protein